MNDPASLFVSYLRQRQELGETELVLEPDTLALLRRARPTKMSEAFEAKRPAVRGSTPSPAPPVEPIAGVAATPAGRVTRVVDPPVDRVARVAAMPLVSLGSLQEVGAVACVCTACGLATTRSTVVFGEGSPTAKLMVVGEAPGADEDRTGRPFVGRAGKLLDSLLASIGFSRESVYICNVLKCRPPSNRNPQPEEVESCSPFLRRQVELIGPRAILAVGNFAAQTLLGTTESISVLRGSVRSYAGVPLVPTYHPAALLRNPSWIRPVWDDLQRLRAVLDD